MRVLLVACINAAGLIGLVAWGWIGATIFLLCGGGMDASGIEEPILPYMLKLGSWGLGFGFLLALLPWIKNRPRCRTAPWSWMLRVLLSSAVVFAFGWCALIFGA